MRRIKELRIQNFKAFQQEEVFDFGKNGKNVLVYGNNGSGKSSVFWALYTLLQSSTKDDVGVQKYFKDYNESDRDTHQSLKNVFIDGNEESFIKLTSIDTETNKEETYTISHDVINTNNDEDTIIQELNLASDFINYKLLHNFYRGSHKDKVNLWPVFERDIFPFLTEGTQNWLEDIIKAKTTDVPKNAGGRTVSGGKRTRYEDELRELNERIQSLLSEISENANTFMKDHFFGGNDVIRISLNFSNNFNFSLVKEKIWDDNMQDRRHYALRITLGVKILDNGDPGTWRKIERVQSFLNEAQLTRIAIGIRIGALRSRVQGTTFKTLVLDDMLISLDMSNRMEVVRVLLNTESDEDLENIFGGFQKIILTHDLGFYELVKRYTIPEEWEYYKFHTSDLVSEAPIIRNDRSRIEKAQAFLVEGEYDACGNELRKEAEMLLDKYLRGLNLASTGEFEPLMNKLNRALKQITENKRKSFKRAINTRDLPKETLEKLNSDFENDSTLQPADIRKLRRIRSELTNYLVEQLELNDRSERILDETKDTLRRIMNPASHASFTPLYEAELKKAIDGVIELKEILDQ